MPRVLRNDAILSWVGTAAGVTAYVAVLLGLVGICAMMAGGIIW